uniref:Si:ch73-379j16.2 n=1 Tax=Salarias fasciatus TaxID=181472 RepID=A0A672FK33_SALFA
MLLRKNVFLLKHNTIILTITKKRKKIYSTLFCDKQKYTITIKENVPPGTFLLSINAIDSDEGVNGEIEYSLRSKFRGLASDPFELDRKTGKLTVKGNLDYEEKQVYELKVLASDKGAVSLSTHCNVVIRVVDENDNHPKIDITSISSRIPEDAPPGTVVALIRVTDLDSGVNGQVACSVPSHLPFDLKPSPDGQSYSIVTKNYLDKETMHMYNITITVKDLGSPALSSTKVIHVTVTDVNDNRPVFKRICAQLRYSVPEEVQVGSTIGNVAKDLSLDISTLRSRRFRIVSGPNHALFHLNQNNGVLYVGQIMDRETLCDGTKVCLMNLKIVVENPLEIHYIGVEITDVNDHAPTFPESEQRLEIGENTPLGTRFQIHAARDPDFGTQSVRLYKLTSNDIFDIEVSDSEEDKVPFIVLKKSLDREKKAEHRLSLTATDGGNPSKSGSLNLTITVIDANDNRPVFSKDVYTVSLDENASIGTTVIHVISVKATDLDEGSNGDVEYFFGDEISPILNDMFSIDKDTGEIRVKGEIDFEKTNVYKLDVHARDKGQPPIHTDCRVIIKIRDENDNKPKIEVTSLSKTVSESSTLGTVVSLISITDQDAGLNGKVICSISGDVPFDLKPSFQDNMYSVVVKEHLDRESVSHYDVIIKATDCGQPPLSTFKTLSIDVADVNDNRPDFLNNPTEIYLFENNVPGNPIFSVSASDKDLNENAALTYHIFREEHRYQKIFQVVATDSGTPSLSNNVTVNVFILDQNDNAPVILYPLSSNAKHHKTFKSAHIYFGHSKREMQEQAMFYKLNN